MSYVQYGMIKALPIVLAAIFLLPHPLLAQEAYFDPDYQTCVDRIVDDPKRGRYFAMRWITDGGGDPAVYCAAVADLAMNLPRVAGQRLQSLAEKNRSTDPYLSARLYSQAAQAWSRGNEDERALAAIENARRMAPASDEVRLLAAPVYAEAGKWSMTKGVLDEAEATTPLTADALVLRARAQYELTDAEAAATDLQQALNIDPNNIEGLLLRGELSQAGYVLAPYTAE